MIKLMCKDEGGQSARKENSKLPTVVEFVFSFVL